MPPKKSLLEILIQKINFNSILLAIITGGFGYMTIRIETKQDTAIAKQDSTTLKQQSVQVVDSSWRVSNRQWRLKTDSTLAEIKAELKKKK